MLSKLVLFLFYFNCVYCSITHYKASVVDVSKSDVAINKYESLVLEAAAAHVDLLVLTPIRIRAETIDSCVTDSDNYDEVVKVISKAAKTGGIYVVAQVYEKTRCQYRDESVLSNMVFNRAGGVVAATPLSSATKCNETEPKVVKFTTDFGVSFALVSEEDVVLHRVEYFGGIKNFIVSGLLTDIPHLSAEQFISSWSFVNKLNVISPNGLFGADVNNLFIAEFQKSGGPSRLITTSSSHEGFRHQHLDKKSLDIEAQGYTGTVCDGSFCCNFYVKTSDIDSSVHYTLSAHSDMVQLAHQRVAVRVCDVRSKLRTEIKFDKIIITANFTAGSAQLPSATTIEPTTISNIVLDNNSAELYDTSVLTFSVLSRDYTNDNVAGSQDRTNIHTDNISFKNVNDFFDYVWIRVRVLIFIVSIYILEML